MDSKFLRDEAARFRGMAEAQDREASRQRLLKMAADYEAKADAADAPSAADSTEADSPEAARPRVATRVAKDEKAAI